MQPTTEQKKKKDLPWSFAAAAGNLLLLGQLRLIIANAMVRHGSMR